MMCTGNEDAASAVEARGLTKSFGPETVVDGLDFRCRGGEIFSLLGPNGAGKTTTVKMLYGILTPDAGRILYRGRDFARCRQAVKRTLGVCSQNDTLDYDITVRQNLEIFGAYYRMDRAASRERAELLLGQFGLEAHEGFIPRALSGGLKRRLQIARALVNAPNVLFLDEPTTGLDPHARRELWDRLHELRQSGITILLTTHYMEEAEILSDYTVILDQGKIVEKGKPREVVSRHLSERILQIREDDRIVRWLEEKEIPFFRGYGQLAVEGDRGTLDAVIGAFGIADYVFRAPNLEDLFVKFTGKSL